jgi:hypothetical protein
MDKITLSSYKSRTSAKPSQNNKSMYAVTQFVLIIIIIKKISFGFETLKEI